MGYFTVQLPLSKSVGARMLVIGGLCGVMPERLLPCAGGLCDDLRVMAGACRVLAGGTGGEAVIDLGDSGTAKRMLTAVFGCLDGWRVRLRQSARLAQRGLGRLPEDLQALGAGSVRQEGNVLIVNGRRPEKSLLDTSFELTSQTLSGLMLVAPLCGGLGISWSRLVSAPYVRMTAELMRRQGVAVALDDRHVRVSGEPYVAPTGAAMERDWSAASYAYECVAATGRSVLLPGLSPDSLQGDAEVARIFEVFGVLTVARDGGVLLVRREVDRAPLLLDCDTTPDLMPAVTVAAVLLRKPLTITGIGHLRHKESDRISALAEELAKVGVELATTDDSLTYRGEAWHAPTALFAAHGDHRMVMSLAPLCGGAEGFDHPEAVGKSYPEFFNQFAPLLCLER